jgi:outer membrane protein insertion porin family
VPTRQPRRWARALVALVWALTLVGPGVGNGGAQPFNRGHAQAPATPPGGPPPFVPQPGAPPQTLPPQKVSEVVVRGNQHVPTDQILAAVSTKVNDPLSEEKLRNDVQAILNLGLFADAVVRIEPLADGVRVAFVVVENPVITQIAVTGNTVVPTSDILSALGVSVGQVLNTVALRTGARAVEKLYQDKGYVLARVSDVSVSPEGVLSLALAEGRIEAIKIQGLHKTKDYVVRRELLFHPGDVFNVNAVNQSLRRLFQLQYFSDVKAQPGPGTQPDTVDVIVVVVEQRTAMVSLGAGYATVTGIQGLIGVRDSDFGGNGQTVAASYNSTSLNGNNFTLSFHEPFFEGTRTALDFLGFNQTTIPTDYSRGFNNSFQYNLYQQGGQVTFTQPIGPINFFTYGLKSVVTAFGPPTFGTAAPAGFPFTPGTVNALLIGGIQDTRNDPALPTAGHRIELDTEIALTTLGGGFSFQKYDLDYQHFFPVGGESTIVGHVHLGSGSIALPIQEQYYLGGQTTLRGFTTGRFRGDDIVLITGEYRFPLSNLPFFKHFTGIQAIIFVDAGDTQPHGTGYTFNLHADAGLGIQVKTALGPFRVDYGVSNEGGQLWITTGALF